MKKIFAFVLASLMVLSLVPASAFAAVTKCPATHTSTNCDATLLYTAVANCENVGYQAYVCNDCGAQFMDNMKPKTNHNWVSDSDNAKNNILANCVYQTPGIEYLVCKNCEVGYIVNGEEVGYKTIDFNSVDVHNLVLVSGVGCEKLYQCTLCDAKGYIGKNADGDDILTDEVTHTWEFVEIETEPKWAGGKSSKGTAVYACKDCVATKKVDINAPACAHAAHKDHTKGTKVQSAKNATCTAAGAYLVYKCPDCNQHWYCKTTNCASSHKKASQHSWKNLTDNKLSKLPKHEALGHQDADGNLNGGAGKCGSLYYCTRCNTWQSRGHNNNPLKDSNGNDLIVNPTCTTAGYIYEQCSDCGVISKTDIPATGHEKSEEYYVPATCASPAYKYKVCLNFNCTIVPTIVNNQTVKVVEGITYIGTPNSAAHNLVTNTKVPVGNVNPELYCSGITYEYKICANGCAEYGSGKAVMSDPVLHDFYVSSSAHNFSKSAGNFNAFSSYVVYTCKKCNKSLTGKTIADTEIYKSSFNSKEEALEFFGYIKRIFTYVDGKVVELAPTLRKDYASFGTVEAVFLAKFKEMYRTEASCQTAASVTYAIEDYGTYVTITGEKLPHIPGKTNKGTNATCITAGKHTTYVCQRIGCGVTYWQDAEGNQYTTSAVKNPCFDTVEFVPGSCGEANGYWKCTKCKTCYTDATCSTKYVPAPHKYVTLVSGVAATCNTTGLPEVRYCSVCKAVEINLIYMNGGKELRVNFNVDNSGVAEIGTTWLSDTVTVKVENFVVSYVYDGKTWDTWPAVVTVKKMEDSNNHRGLYIVNEVEAVSEEVTEKVLASGILLSTEVYFDNSEDPIDVKFEELDHTKPSFTLVNCEACVYEYIKNYTAAQGGHRNDKGNLITNDCADGVKGGRECITCKNYYSAIADAEGVDVKTYAQYYTFGAHTLVDVSAETGFTCQSAGYNAQLCTKCNLYIVDPDSYEPADADKYHKSIKEKVEAALESNDFWDLLAIKKYEDGNDADYAQNGLLGYVCDVCAAQIIAPKATPCPGTGIEINMSTEYDEYMPNAYIELVISLDSLKGVNAWGLNFSVGYNPELVKFVSADFSASPFATNKANDVYGLSYTQDTENQMVWHASTKKVAYGIVSIASSSTEGVAIKGNNEYVTLTFQVIEARGQAQFEIGYIIPAVAANRANPAYSIYSANAVGANGKSINLNYNVSMKESMAGVEINNKTHTVDTLAFLDFDADGELTIFDAFELYYLIETDEYDVLADADHDGDVDTDDLDILYAVLVGEKTLKDILAEKEVEEEERVIKYDEEGFVVYDSLYDFNDDGVLSAYEIAVMTGKIDADLNPNT